MPELPNKPKKTILFAAVPFKCEDDEVFVELHPSNTEMAFEYERKKQSELTPGDEVIKCIICGKPASQIDHHFPWEIHDNRCKQHRHSLIDECVYDQYGCGVEVCKDHYRVLSLVSSMTSVADWLMKHPENPDAEPLRQKMIAFKQELDRFMAKQWPEELFGPKKEDKKPDYGIEKYILYTGDNDREVWAVIGIENYQIEPMPYGMRVYRKDNAVFDIPSNTVVFVKKGESCAFHTAKPDDFRKQYPDLPLETEGEQ